MNKLKITTKSIKISYTAWKRLKQIALNQDSTISKVIEELLDGMVKK